MRKVVMTGKWLKDQKRWSTVVALPERATRMSNNDRKQPKPKRKGSVLSFPRESNG